MQDRRQPTGPAARLPAPPSVDAGPVPAAGRPGRKPGERQVAIALSDRKSADASPVIVAKGYGEMAEKILRLAFDNDVKVREDPELAQILATVELDCEIPLDAFAAVAEILSYVYAANRRLADEDEAAARREEAIEP